MVKPRTLPPPHHPRSLQHLASESEAPLRMLSENLALCLCIAFVFPWAPSLIIGDNEGVSSPRERFCSFVSFIYG